MAQCKACGAEIRWFKMMGTGRKMPVNLPGHKAIVDVVHEGEVYGRLATVFTPHWATCPGADSFREKKGGGS